MGKLPSSKPINIRRHHQTAWAAFGGVLLTLGAAALVALLVAEVETPTKRLWCQTWFQVSFGIACLLAVLGLYVIAAALFFRWWLPGLRETIEDSQTGPINLNISPAEGPMTITVATASPQATTGTPPAFAPPPGSTPAAMGAPGAVTRGVPGQPLSSALKMTDLFTTPGQVVRQHTFEHVRLVGPAVAMFRQCRFPHLTIVTPPGGSPNDVFWEMPPGVPLVGGVAFDQCVFDHVEFLDVGIVGTAESLQDFRDALP